MKIRKLERSFDYAAFDAVREEERGVSRRQSSFAGATVTAALEAPVEVDTTDLEASLNEVVAMLRAGKLAVSHSRAR